VPSPPWRQPQQARPTPPWRQTGPDAPNGRSLEQIQPDIQSVSQGGGSGYQHPAFEARKPFLPESIGTGYPIANLLWSKVLRPGASHISEKVGDAISRMREGGASLSRRFSDAGKAANLFVENEITGVPRPEAEISEGPGIMRQTRMGDPATGMDVGPVPWSKAELKYRDLKENSPTGVAELMQVPRYMTRRTTIAPQFFGHFAATALEPEHGRTPEEQAGGWSGNIGSAMGEEVKGLGGMATAIPATAITAMANLSGESVMDRFRRYQSGEVGGEIEGDFERTKRWYKWLTGNELTEQEFANMVAGVYEAPETAEFALRMGGEAFGGAVKGGRSLAGIMRKKPPKMPPNVPPKMPLGEPKAPKPVVKPPISRETGKKPAKSAVVLQSPKQIANGLGVKITGKQEDFVKPNGKIIKGHYEIYDPKTGGNYNVKDIGELSTKVAEKRIEFDKGSTIAEKGETKYQYGNSQATIPKETEAAQGLKGARSKIAQKDHMAQGTDVGGDHVTVRYGIKGDNTAGIRKYLEEQSPFQVTLRSSKKFEPSESSDNAAVIYAPAESADLSRLNVELESHGDFIPPTQGKYKPHATIAYVKPEAADKYVGMSETEGKSFTVDRIVISKADGTKEAIKLASAKPPVTPEPEAKPPTTKLKARPTVAKTATVHPTVKKSLTVEGKQHAPHDMPKGWTVRVQSNWRKSPGWKAEVDWREKQIVFETKADAANPSIVNHEIAHILIEDKLLDVGYGIQEMSESKSSFLNEYAKTTNHMGSPPNFVKELMAMDYGNYLSDPTSVTPKVADVFNKYMTKPIAKTQKEAAVDVARKRAERKARSTAKTPKKIAKGIAGATGIAGALKRDKPTSKVKTAPKVPTPPPKPPTVKGLPSKPHQIVGLSKVENAEVRRRYGLDKLPKDRVESFTYSASEAKLRGLDKSAIETAREVLKSKRPLSATERAGMNLKAAELIREYEKTEADVSRLIEEGQINKASRARIRAEAILDNLELLTEGSDVGGRELGRGMSIGRMLIDSESMDLASVMRRYRVAKTKPATDKEITQQKELVRKYEEATEELERARAENNRLIAEREKAIAERIAAIETKKSKISSRAAKSRSKILTERADIQKQLQGLGFRRNDITGVSAEGSYLIGRLALNYIREGVVTLDEVVRKVIADFPDITERDVWRALNERDPKRQRKLQSEAQRQERFLKRQARLLENIAKAEEGIFHKPKKRAEATAEIKALQKKYRQLRRDAYKKGNNDIQADLLERTLLRISEATEQLEGQYRSVRKGKTIPSEEVASARAKLKEIRTTMRTQDRLADLQEQLRTGDFKDTKPAPAKSESRKLTKARIDVKRARRAIQQAKEDARPWGVGKVWGELIHTQRTAKATGDVSFTFRQLILPVLAHPFVAAKVSVKALQAMFHSYTCEKINTFLRDGPDSYIYDVAGVKILDSSSPVMSQRADIFRARLLEKIPVLGHIIRGSNRHATTLGNLFRTYLFDRWYKQNPNATVPEMRAYGDVVNVFTGIGDLSKLGPTTRKILSAGLWSPELTTSRFQAPYMIWKYRKMPRVRKQIAMEYARAIGTGMTLMAIAKLYWPEADIGTNPEDADFGKIVYKNSHIDIWGGFQQPIRLMLRGLLIGTDLAGVTGRELETRKREKDYYKILSQYLSYKVSPIVGLAREITTGKTAVGEKISIPEALKGSVTPFTIQDIKDANKIEGVGWVVAGGMALTGVGIGTYERKYDRLDALVELKKTNYSEYVKSRLAWNKANPTRKITPEAVTKHGKWDTVVAKRTRRESRIGRLLKSGQREEAMKALKEWNARYPKSTITLPLQSTSKTRKKSRPKR